MNLFFSGPRSVFHSDPNLIGHLDLTEPLYGPIRPSYGSSRSPEIAVNELTLGDGYTQYSAEGLNTVRGVFNLTFSNRSRYIIDAVERFLEGERPTSIYDRSPEEWFYWTPLRTVQRQVPETIRCVCLKWNVAEAQFNQATLTCTFKQVFTP